MSYYIEAPAQWSAGQNRDVPAIFLAGSITGAPHWQSEATELLRPYPVIILNPRRKDFDVRDPSASDVQVEWEFDAIQRADVVLFWFPEYGPSGLAPITLYELGRAAALERDIAVGVQPGFAREFDVRKQLSLARPTVNVHAALADVCNQALVLALPR